MKKIISIFSVNRKQSIEAVLAPHIQCLYRQAYHYMGDKHAAEDLLQDLFVYVCERREMLFKLDPVKPWLMKCLYHRFIDNHRKRQSRITEVPIDEGLLQLAMTHNMTELEQVNDSVRKALSTLEGEQRVAISLFYIEGYPLKQVAETLDLPEGTIKSHLYRGRKKLKAFLSKDSSVDKIKSSEPKFALRRRRVLL